MQSGWGPAPSASWVGAIQSFPFPPASGKWLPYGVGGTYNYDDYPQLGAVYGVGPGEQFALPDFRGKALFVADGSNAAGSTTGTNTRNIEHNHGGNTGGDSSSSSKFILSILGSAASDSGHDHPIDNDLSDPIDIRPARGYLDLYIRALP